MFGYLRRLFRREMPLAGAPPVRRLKTYSAESGYVYQYYFAGFRPTPEGYEYVFSASRDRQAWTPVAVRLSREVLERWANRFARELTASERFGIAKIALRRAFDTAESPSGLHGGVRVTDEELREIAEFLDLL